MNKENIKGYNDLLIKYLNDLVNDVEKNDDIKNRNFDDVIKRLEEQLSPYNITFNKQVIKVILTNSFKKYSGILKTYFDSSNIHRIDENTNDNLLSKTMNDVTDNLSLAVNNMNKIKEYRDLIVLIKKNINTHFVQMKNDITNIKYEIDQILNDVIVGYMNTYISTKVSDFNKDILPELYKISDEINYETEKIIDATKEEETINVNLERDQFINETMDIEIHEKVENGVLTLQVIDQMGNDNIYYGKEAMEKLTSYNQLFESSRPGKKADTSNWPEIVEEEIPQPQPQTQPEEITVEEEPIVEEVKEEKPKKKKNKREKKKKEKEEVPQEEIVNTEPTPVYDDFNNLTAPINQEEIISTQPTIYDDFNNSTTSINQDGVEIPNEESINNNEFENYQSPETFEEETNTEPIPTYDETTEINQGNIEISNGESINDKEDNIISNEIEETVPEETNIQPTPTYDETTDNIEEEKETENKPIINLTDQFTNTTPTNENEEMIKEFLSNYKDNPGNSEIKTEDNNESEIEESLNKVQSMMNYENGSFFILEYDNANSDRDEYIRNTVGDQIEEDTDNKGLLYLKVIEPSGREVIYTGKQAINMIKDYDSEYEKGTGKKADTTLIDKFSKI